MPRASCRKRCCDAVKPQGGKSQAHILKALVDAGIPTASHIGLTPHTIAMFGGFKIQGRTAEAAMKILEDALAIEDAGCFMLEFEAVPARIAKLISEQLTIPTIGIGAGAGCDGQILLCLRPARGVHGLQAEIHQAIREADRGGGRRHPASTSKRSRTAPFPTTNIPTGSMKRNTRNSCPSSNTESG